MRAHEVAVDHAVDRQDHALAGGEGAVDVLLVRREADGVARRVGVRDEVIEAIRSGKAPMGLPPKEGVFAQVAKEMVIGKGLSDRTFQAVEHLLGPEQTVELIVLVGYYSMLSRVMDALGLELEPGVEPGLPESA